MIDRSCPDCARLTGGCERHSRMFVQDFTPPPLPNMLDGLPLDQRLVWDGITHVAVASLCKEDKEQLNRIEDFLKMMLSAGWQVSLLPECRDVGAQCGDPNCTRKVVLTAPETWTHLVRI